MKEFGIDISRHNGNFDLERAVKEGVRFVILKGGGGDDGLYTDARFAKNYEKCKALGLPVGVYWFSRALSDADAKKEAEYFYENCLMGRQFELPVYIDVENAAMIKIGKRRLTDTVRTWCDTLEDKGFFVGIYSSTYYFRAYMYDAELQAYTHWVAQWNSECTYPYPDVLGVWQFGGETNLIRSNKVAGKICDQDYLYTDFPYRIEKAGLNGFGRQPEKTIREVAEEVIRGDWGNGDERKLRLKAAGYDPKAVQQEVNRILYG